MVRTTILSILVDMDTISQERLEEMSANLAQKRSPGLKDEVFFVGHQRSLRPPKMPLT